MNNASKKMLFLALATTAFAGEAALLALCALAGFAGFGRCLGAEHPWLALLLELGLIYVPAGLGVFSMLRSGALRTLSGVELVGLALFVSYAFAFAILVRVPIACEPDLGWRYYEAAQRTLSATYWGVPWVAILHLIGWSGTVGFLLALRRRISPRLTEPGLPSHILTLGGVLLLGIGVNAIIFFASGASVGGVGATG